jgi:hypothetical protein
MKNSLRHLFAVYFSFLFLLGACKTGEEESKPAVNVDSSANVTTDNPESGQKLITGNLDTLWTERPGIDALQYNRLVFSFTFSQAGGLTMHGWSFKGALASKEFDSLPSIKLGNARPGPIPLEPGLYFGNVVLDDINELKRVLRRNNAQYVIFAPEKKGNNVKYNIFVSKESPIAFDKVLALIPSGLSANPSPPKNRSGSD